MNGAQALNLASIWVSYCRGSVITGRIVFQWQYVGGLRLQALILPSTELVLYVRTVIANV